MKPGALSTRRIVTVAIIVGLVATGIGLGVLRSTPVEAECYQVRHRNGSTGMCTWGGGPCRNTGC